MASRNICKFNYSRASDLICTNFVLEAEAMQAGTQSLQYNLIGLAAEGEGVLKMAGKEYPLVPGVMFFVPRFTQFSIQPVQQLQYYYISYHGRRAEEYMTRMGIDQDRCVFCGYEALIPFWESSQHLAEEGNIDMVCEAVLLYTLANLRPEKADRHNLLNRILSMVQERYTDPDFNVTVVAEELGYDAKYLSCFFKKKKGITFTRYLRDLRLHHAIFLMEEGLTVVKNIALLSGYRDPLYFSKIFAQCEGVSPKEYMERMQTHESDV